MLKQIHDDLDAAVAEAYGWPVPSAGSIRLPSALRLRLEESSSKSGQAMTDEQILQKLVALNAERAVEEKRGIIRWLRPEFQNPGGAATTQESLGLAIEAKPVKPKGAKKPVWPKDLVGQISAVRALLATSAKPMKAVDVAGAFSKAKVEKVTELLAALEALGQARKLDGDRFAA